MKRIFYAVSLVVIIAAAFLAGNLYNKWSAGEGSAAGGRKILYYVDPMNPGFRSDKPGIAPCGMKLEPVYSDGGQSTPGVNTVPAYLPQGTVQIPPARQQTIGVKVAQVEKTPWSYQLRVLGRVAADEKRLYRINASSELWVRKMSPATTGDFVKRDQLLLSFYNTNFLSSAGAYIYAVGTLDKYKEVNSPEQSSTRNYQVRQAIESLQNLGVSNTQIKEMERTRKISEFVDVRSPTSGIVLSRNVSLGQWVGAGTELYRIADLSRVWVLVDTYENEAQHFRPGNTVHVHYQGREFPARVSSALPQFDPATRTLKVRLEADNPGYALRPDMFVDVDFSVRMSPAITVPAEAVLDSGLKKTVFVDRGNGYFEPRKVETGRYFDDRVEIVKGLKTGERIVVSGNFLLDSESRMKTASAGMSGTGSVDPSCGMMVDEGRSRSANLTSEYKGMTYYFCSTECKTKFDKSPQKYTGKPPEMEMRDKDMDSGGRMHESESGGHHHE